MRLKSTYYILTQKLITQIIYGEALRQIMMLRSYAMSKALFYETLGVEKLVHIDLICVQSEHQRQGVGTALLRSCVARATESAIPCVGEFTSGAAQTIGKSPLILRDVRINRFLQNFVTPCTIYVPRHLAPSLL